MTSDHRWTAEQIEYALVRYDKSPFSYRRHLAVIPNLSHGFGLRYEADLIAITKARAVKEIEIKISRTDFEADAQKQKHRVGLDSKISEFWYAMPETVWAESQDVWRVAGAGVITVRLHTTSWGSRQFLVNRVIAAEKLSGHVLSDDQLVNALRLASMRIWGPRHRDVEKILRDDDGED